MLRPLTDAERAWVNTTLAKMTIEEKVGHLLCPDDQNYSVDEWLAIIKDVPLGSIFVGYNDVTKTRAVLEAVHAANQQAGHPPLMIASDLEHGAGAMITECTNFPFPMALGAAIAGGG